MWADGEQVTLSDSRKSCRKTTAILETCDIRKHLIRVRRIYNLTNKDQHAYSPSNLATYQPTNLATYANTRVLWPLRHLIWVPRPPVLTKVYFPKVYWIWICILWKCGNRIFWKCIGLDLTGFEVLLIFFTAKLSISRFNIIWIYSTLGSKKWLCLGEGSITRVTEIVL